MRIYLGVHSESLGHFIRETEILSNLIIANPDIVERKKVVLCTQRHISNSYFLQILKESFKILKWPFGWTLQRVFNRISRKHQNSHEFFLDRNHEFVINIHKSPSILLNERLEKQIALHFEYHKEELGFDNYRIFAIRDSGYDESKFKKFDPRDQEYRNTPINYFIPSFNYLNSVGSGSVRVGRHNKTLITSVYNHGIEIGNIECNNPDLCDFAMFYGASRVYSTGTGIDDIGLLLRKETIYLNIAPFGNVPQTPLIRVMLASDYFDSEGKRLSLSELINRNYHKLRPNELIKQGKVQIKPKNSDFLLKLISFVEGAKSDEDGKDMVNRMANLGWGEQWQNVLY